MCSVHEMTREGEARTRLCIDGFPKDKVLRRFLFAVLLKKKLTHWFEASSANLNRYWEENAAEPG